MNDAQRASLAALRRDYEGRGVDVDGFDGEDDLVQGSLRPLPAPRSGCTSIAPHGRLAEPG